jgi:hypothetical protein
MRPQNACKRADLAASAIATNPAAAAAATVAIGDGSLKVMLMVVVVGGVGAA